MKNYNNVIAIFQRIIIKNYNNIKTIFQYDYYEKLKN